MFPYIVADIGGTNARFALATGRQGQQFAIESVTISNGADFPSFEDALQAYVDSLENLSVAAACIAIAGPVGGDVVRMTNLPWSFSKRHIQRKFALTTFEVINDFAAVAIATSRLADADLIAIKGGNADPVANKAILGPGTGLGVAGLAHCARDNSWLPIAGEGGHVTLAPADIFEAEVIVAGMRRFGHVSAEMFISGPGLVNLYACLCDVEGVEAKALQPQDVTTAALAGDDAVCEKTLALFCAFLGTVAGDLALTYGAKGGVYLAGGIAPRIIDFLKASEFSARFANKGIMSHYVENVAVNLVRHQQTAFLGAAAWLEQLARGGRRCAIQS